MARLLTLFIFLTSSLALAQVTELGPEGDCGFSKLQPMIITHYVQRDVTRKISPEYPPAAKAKGVTGTVRVRILINSNGLVEKTCPEFVVNQRHPDRSLVIAAEAAALRWTFVPHFGFSSNDGLRFKYVQDVLIFDFRLNGSNKSGVDPIRSP